MPMEEIESAIEELSSGQTSPPTASEPSAPSEGSSALGGEEHDFREEPSRARDDSGKFKPKVVAKDEVPEDAVILEDGKPSAAPQPPANQSLRAPVSWKPEEREGWEKLDARHQQAIIRRERETSQALSHSAQAREFTQQVQQTLEPYMQMIAAEQSTPAQAIGALFQTAATLRTAPPMHKANLIADLIMQYQIDPSMLDGALSAKLRGQPAPNDPMSHIMAQFDQRLKPLVDQLGTLKQRESQHTQAIEAQATETLTEFMENPDNEFAQDVSEDMADLLEMASKRGYTLTLQDAYRRATLAHPTISKIMERRMLKGGAAQQSAAASRARQASASITDSGAPSQTVEDTGDGDVRSALTASIRSLASRR